MGTRTARGANAGSLFPFLAVLICAMGALILLLLVTTRRIRQQQLRQSAVVAAQAEMPTPEARPAALPAPEEPRADDVLKTVPPLLQAPDPWDEPLEPLFAAEAPPPLPDPNDAWRERLKALEAEHSRLASAVTEHESTVARIRTSVEGDSHSAGDFQAQQADADKQIRNIESAQRRLRQQQSDSHSQAALLRRQIDESRERLADGSSKFTIMPFDGRRGTTRRPIIIECTDRGLTFVSEGVTLKPTDLEGFNSRYNPLLAATKALTKYWDRTDRRNAVQQGEAGRDTQPYVLLVVRPQGTIGYYAARAMLGRMDESFGYELVGEDQEFVWPEFDETAAELCRSIVEQMLSERESLMASVPGALSDELGRFSDETGRFRLDEVDRLRNPAKQVTINGQTYRRDPTATWLPEATGQPEGTWKPGAAWKPGAGWQPGTTNSVRDHKPDIQGAGDGIDVTAPSQDLASQPRVGDRSEPSAEEAQDSEASTPPGRAARLDRSAHPLRDEIGGTATGSVPKPSEASSFSRFARNSRSSSQGSTPTPGSPAPLDLSLSRRSAAQAAMDSGRPQWGLRARGGAIGFEREIFVRVTATEVSIADETTFPVSDGLPSDELRRLFLLHLEHHIQGWSEPPRSFYWLPKIKFVVSPGGSRSHDRLKSLVEEWELRSTVQHVRE